MLSRVLAKNIGDVFLRHSVYEVMYTVMDCEKRFVLTVDRWLLQMWERWSHRARVS